MSDNFKDSIKDNINLNSNTKVKDEDIKYNANTESKFHLAKKKIDKTNKKTFPVYMENDLLKKLTAISKKSGYSRNELINIMCNWCADNLDFTEE